ncbi:hypothetical protein Peur_021942 [Populus x canadensis]
MTDHIWSRLLPIAFGIASFDDTTSIWEINDGDFECVAALEGHENEVKSVPWNASGSLLQTCSWDKTVWICEVMPGNESECVSVFPRTLKMVKWHPAMDVLFSYDKVWAEDGTGDCHCVQTLRESSKWALRIFNHYVGLADIVSFCIDFNFVLL